MAWRFATWTTSRSPVLVNATTEGVVRPPSALGMTLGSPPSITATHEFVVPRSIPMTLPMNEPSFPQVQTTPATRGRGRGCVIVAGILTDLNFDLTHAGLLGLGHVDLEHPV